jgi:glycosyltransferase involved in cell wall biosynthesis
MHNHVLRATPSFSMLGWAYNEEENVAAYIERAEAFLSALTDDFELILIEDCSTDRTMQIALQHQKTRPWLRIYQHDRNRNCGFNARRAVSLATKEYLFWQTVDWSYDISLLPQVLPYLEEFDVLQGARFNTFSWRGLGTRSDNRIKALVSMINYLLVRVLFRLPIHDYQNVTLYPTKLIQSVELVSDSAFINPECLLKTWWKGTRVKEFRVGFCKRERGEAKGTKPKMIWNAIKDIVGYWWNWIVRGQRQDRGQGQVSYWTAEDEAALRAAERPEVVLPLRKSA